MGLDDFKTGDGDSNEPEDSDNSEETTSSEETGGLESFKTDNTTGGSDTSSGSDGSDNTIHGVNPSKWNSMSVNERIEHVRDAEIGDYYPSKQVDEGWDYARCIEVSCVCGNMFTFSTSGGCFQCGRRYEDRGRTVVMKSDPTGDSSNE